MHDTEQSWEVACQDLVQSLGVHSPANTLMEATLLADVLALSGERVHLYSQRVQHRFGTWAGLGKGEPQNIRWQTARKEEETLVGVQWGDRLVFPCGAGSLDTLLATEHDRWANVKAEGFSWQELSSSFIAPPELLAWTPRNKATLSPSEAQAVDHWGRPQPFHSPTWNGCFARWATSACPPITSNGRFTTPAFCSVNGGWRATGGTWIHRSFGNRRNGDGGKIGVTKWFFTVNPG